MAFTQLTWQVPPIICDELFNDIPFWEYLDVGLPVKEEAFYSFYYETMLLLYNETHKVLDNKGYKNAAAGLRCSKPEKDYWLALPEGYPAGLTDTAGALFAMECAHIMKMGGLAVDLFETDNDYWVLTKSGYEVGVKGGRPLVNSAEWDTDVSGLVPDLLRMPRGNPFVGCDYDLVSKLRSFLWEHKARLSRSDFVTTDYALQILRIIGVHTVNPVIQQLVRGLRDTPVQSKRKVALLVDALSLIESPAVSDRQKILGVKNMLVPEVINKSTFTKSMYNYHRAPPAMVEAAVMDRFRVNINILLEKEKSHYAVKT